MQKNLNEEVCSSRLIIRSKWNKEIDQEIREEIHMMDEFEFYFGITETPERLQQFTINRELFYSIIEKEHNVLIGYLGFTERENAWEPEIYIFNSFRGNGFGTEALKTMISKLFAGVLFVKQNGEKEKITTECVISTVRAENIASHRMMEKIGFKRDEDVACCFALFINPENEEDSGFFEIAEYSLTKNMFYNM